MDGGKIDLYRAASFIPLRFDIKYGRTIPMPQGGVPSALR